MGGGCKEPMYGSLRPRLDLRGSVPVTLFSFFPGLLQSTLVPIWQPSSAVRQTRQGHQNEAGRRASDGCRWLGPSAGTMARSGRGDGECLAVFPLARPPLRCEMACYELFRRDDARVARVTGSTRQGYRGQTSVGMEWRGWESQGSLPSPPLKLLLSAFWLLRRLLRASCWDICSPCLVDARLERGRENVVWLGPRLPGAHPLRDVPLPCFARPVPSSISLRVHAMPCSPAVGGIVPRAKRSL